MNAPPKDVSASELFAKLSAMPRAFEVVDFPRNDPQSGAPVAQVAIWPLRQDEQEAANVDTEKKVRELLKKRGLENLRSSEISKGYEDAFNNEAAVQILWRCLRKADDVTKPAFLRADELRQSLTTDEVASLFNSYLRVQSALGPITAYLSPEEMDLWVDRLVEGGRVNPLDSWSSAQLGTFILHMASRLKSFQTEPSYAGSQPGESISDSPSLPSSPEAE